MSGGSRWHALLQLSIVPHYATGKHSWTKEKKTFFRVLLIFVASWIGISLIGLSHHFHILPTPVKRRTEGSSCRRVFYECLIYVCLCQISKSTRVKIEGIKRKRCQTTLKDWCSFVFFLFDVCVDLFAVATTVDKDIMAVKWSFQCMKLFFFFFACVVFFLFYKLGKFFKVMEACLSRRKEHGNGIVRGEKSLLLYFRGCDFNDCF